MNVSIKSPEEIQKMRIAGKLAAEVLEMIEPHVQAGITTEQLNQICHDYMVNEQQSIPAPLNYRGFPKSICTSVNNQICYGIPNDKILKKGDIINIDITVIKDGYHGDTSKTYFIGEPSIKARRVTEASQASMYEAIKTVKPGLALNQIGKTIEEYIAPFNFSIVREYCGHGIGLQFHEAPQVLHYYEKHPNQPCILEAGMTFTIEPMINVGKRHTKLLPDNWTVVTKDRSLSAQFEHTILVTDTGFEVLTLRSEEATVFTT
jgi:methionyl aminopeptidase